MPVKPRDIALRAASAVVLAPAAVAIDELQAELEELANELMVDLSLSVD